MIARPLTQSPKAIAASEPLEDPVRGSFAALGVALVGVTAVVAVVVVTGEDVAQVGFVNVSLISVTLIRPGIRGGSIPWK